jgi:hypothetical protein
MLYMAKDFLYHNFIIQLQRRVISFVKFRLNLNVFYRPDNTLLCGDYLLLLYHYAEVHCMFNCIDRLGYHLTRSNSTVQELKLWNMPISVLRNWFDRPIKEEPKKISGPGCHCVHMLDRARTGVVGSNPSSYWYIDAFRAFCLSTAVSAGHA